MTIPFGANRRSPRQLLFDWRATDRSLTARIGQLGALTRASAAWSVDENGVLAPVANNVPRFGYVGANFGLLLEGARTNDLTFPRTLSNAAWTATSCTVGSTLGADSIIGSGSRLTATAGNATVIRAAALVHASQARAASLRIKRIVGTGAVQLTLDGGATWTALTVTSSYGSQSVTQTLANSQFGIRLVANGDVVDVDVTQNEAGGYPTSFIAGARSADVLAFPFKAPASRLAATGVALYDDLITLRPAAAFGYYSEELVLGETGSFGNNCLLIASGDTPTSIASGMENGGAYVSQATLNPAYNAGDRIERLLLMTPAGGSTLIVSVNGGAASTQIGTAAAVWPAAFDAPNLSFAGAGASAGTMLRRAVRIATGNPTLTQMQQFDLN
jgi:hypothetical protein